MFKITNVLGKTLTIDVELKECRNCHRAMLPRGITGSWPFVNSRLLLDAVRQNEIRIEAGYWEVEVVGLCETCLEKGGYFRQCDLCEQSTLFPDGFAFRLEYYPKYPDDDRTRDYICGSCVRDRAQEVIEAMATASNIEDLRKGKA